MRSSRPIAKVLTLAMLFAALVTTHCLSAAQPATARNQSVIAVPKPTPAGRPSHPSAALAQSARKRVVDGLKSWGYQLNGLDVAEARRSPYDLLVVDATTGLRAGRIMTADDVARLKAKTDGSRRIVVSYLSIGEAEDYRPDYFSKEYLEEDSPIGCCTKSAVERQSHHPLLQGRLAANDHR